MFSRRLPAHLVPGLEYVIDQYLRGATRNIKAPEDFEVVILPVALPTLRRPFYVKPCPECGSTAKAHFCPGKSGMEPVVYASESDESIPVPEDTDDGA